MLAALIAGTYAGLLALVMSLATMAKRADTEMEVRAPVARDGLSGPEADRLAAAVHGAIEAERVTVVAADAGDPGMGRIAAGIGVPDLLGARVRLPAGRITGVVRAAEAAPLGLPFPPRSSALWRYAHVPLIRDGALVGAVTVARRWRPFTEEELWFAEHVAQPSRAVAATPRSAPVAAGPHTSPWDG
jgi:GAF domain-containing protein